jgi:hypothetical protein
LFHTDPAIGFLAHAQKFSAAVAQAKVLAPAKTLEEMQRVIVNDYVDAGLTAIFIVVVLAMIVAGFVTIRKAMADPNASTKETGNDMPGLQPLKA